MGRKKRVEIPTYSEEGVHLPETKEDLIESPRRP